MSNATFEVAPPDGPSARSISVTMTATATGVAVRAALSFVSGIVVSRSLGSAGRGRYAYVLNSLAIILMVGGGGSYAALAAARLDERWSWRSLVRSSALLAGVVGAALGAISVGLYSLLRGSIFAGVTTAEALVVGFLAVPTVVLNWWSGVLALRNRIVGYTVATAAAAGVYLAAVLALMLADRLNVTSAVIAWAVSSLIPFAACRRIGWSHEPDKTAGAIPLLRRAAKASAADLLMLLVLRADVFAVKNLRGFSELGQYAVALTLAEALLLLGHSLRLGLVPLQGDPARTRELEAAVRRATRISLPLGVLVCAASTVIGGPVIRFLYGPSFDTAAPALTLLLPGIVLLSVQGPVRDYLLARGRSGGLLLSSAVVLAANVAGNLYLLRTHTFLAAAALSSVAYFANGVAALYLFRRTAGGSWKDLLIVRRADLGR
jgi:O-antigen/teichoic acid export membrane protein